MALDIYGKTDLRDLIVGQLAANGDLRTLALSLGLDWNDIERRAGVVWGPASTQEMPSAVELLGLDRLDQLDTARYRWWDEQFRQMKGRQ